MSENNDTTDSSIANNYDADMFDMNDTTDTDDAAEAIEAEFNYDSTEITGDDPKALVSRTGDFWHVIGMDNGETVYAEDIASETLANIVANEINATRDGHEFHADDEDNITVATPDAPEYESNAERVNNDYDDVLFALTDETSEVGESVDQDDYEMNAEALADDEDVRFAITNEDGLGPRDLLKNAAFGLLAGYVFYAILSFIERNDSDDTEADQ